MADAGIKGSVKGALKALEDGWGDVEEQSFGDVPEGKYQVKIEGALLNNAKSSGRFQCSWTMVILDGEHRGRKLFKHDGLQDETALGWFRTGLARLGLEWPAKASELPAVLEEAIDSFAQVTVKHKGDFVNVYFDQAIDSDNVDDLPEDDDESDETDGDSVDVGTKVMAKWSDGDKYPGEIIQLGDEAATVRFEDGDELEVSYNDMDIISDSDEDDDESEEEPDEEEPEEEEEGDDDADDDASDAEETCEPEFDDDKLTEAHQAQITALAEAQDFDPDDYETWTALLGDVAEYVGVFGKFATPAKLLKAVKAATNE
jgi:hypothetical protein